MVMPYNLRKSSRDSSNDMPSNTSTTTTGPRCTFTCISSSSSSCSSSQSSQSTSPSPTNFSITTPASKLIFGQHLSFESDSTTGESDQDNCHEDSLNNYTLIDDHGNETIQNMHTPVTNWFSSGITTRSRSRNYDVELKSATTSLKQNPTYELDMSPNPPTSGIQTRSSRISAQTTTTTNSLITMCQTRSCVSRATRSRLPVASSKPPINPENAGELGKIANKLGIIKSDVGNLPAAQINNPNARERKSSISQPKLIRKKRQSLTTSKPMEDNDHDEDSSDDRVPSVSIDGMVVATRTSRVSFQISTELESQAPMAKRRTGKTPPHKKFRKLRLYDTPQTPKTLLKKAQPIPSDHTDPVINNIIQKKTNTPNTISKKHLTATDVIKAVVRPASPLTMPQSKNNTIKKTVIEPKIVQKPPQSPPRQIQSHREGPVTPKASRLSTPGALLKAPVPFNPNSSSPESSMDVDQSLPTIRPSQRKETLPISGPSVITSSAHSRRLFDFNSNGSDMSCVMAQQQSTINMNKKLQFDDSDCEESDSNNHNQVRSCQVKSLSYDSDSMPERPSAVSPVSSTSSWCSGANTQYMPQHLAKLKALSSSSNSLFKPISRFIGVGLGGQGLSSSSAGGLNSLRSPNSPFQLNHVANINPFTPTNAFSGASTANIITNLPGTHGNTNGSLPEINTLKDYKSHTSTKRSFNEQEAHYEHQTNSNDMDLADPNSLDSTNTNQNTTDNNAPRNKRLALRQCLVSRYHEEFHEVCKLGNGEFGDVFKCINRLDGCTYAIKRSKKPIAGSALEVAAWKEVCAHAVLVKHSHIVQYYSAWAEADRMLIQNEYCNGGSLAEFIDHLRSQNFNASHRYQEPTQTTPSNTSLMNEYDLKLLLLHIAKGLAYMHSLNLVHLDIKPGNIFICRQPRRQHPIQDKSDNNTTGLVINEESGIESEGFDDDDDDACALTISNKTKHSGHVTSIFSDVITYKIGDLGHVTSTLDPHVEEGDCRYLPNEILQEQYEHLPKADVFALALTVLACGTLEELPKNGDDWHLIRQGNFKDMPQCNDRFKKLLTQMIDENPVVRPSASTLIHHPCIVPDASKSKSQLRKELNQEKFKNEMLKLKVQRYEQQLTNSKDSPQPNNFLLNPINSIKFNRSVSSTLL